MVGFGNVLVWKSNKIVLKKKKNQNHFHILKVLSNLAIIIRRCTHQPSPHTLMDFHTLISKLASPIVKNKDKFVSFDLCVRFSRKKKKKLVLTYIRLQRRMLQYTKNYDCHTQLSYKEYLVVWVSHQFFNSLLYKCGFSFFFFLDSTQAQVESRNLGPQRVLYLLFGGLGLFHRRYIGLITNQVVHKIWILQHIHIHTCKYTYIAKQMAKE